MPNAMKVVFRSAVRGIANAGEVKTVSSGYARNFLFPRRLAFPATDTALRQWETERQGTLAKATRLQEQAAALAQRIEAADCTVTAKARPDGRLFGSVHRQEIAEALAQQGIQVDKRAILLSEPLRQTGAVAVPVRLGLGVRAQLKLNVVPQS